MEWDVKIGDEINYFDPTLSYELTKYIPINKTSGLDFNPDWFREDAIHKIETGNYSGTPLRSPSYKAFWDERMRRCQDGYESHGYRITGDNYFWLNYYRLKSSNKDKKAGAGRQMNFPTFFVFQYEYFHYVEMCEMLKKDVGLLKARALGFSEMAASLCARPYITDKNYRVIATAASEKHLKPLLAKVWTQLNFLNNETEGAFKRVRMVVDTKTHKRASKKTRDGDEVGHMAEIEGIVVDEPDKMRGDRVERLFMEESGSNPVFTKSYLQGEALITVLGGDRIGTRFAWGTGGDSGKAVEGIKDMTTKPDVYNVLKFKNTHTPDGKPIYTAMFIPAYASVLRHMDKRGWCDPVVAKEFYEGERRKKVDDPKALLIYKAEYCFTIEEALIQQGDNMFPREELAEQLAQLQVYKTGPTVHTGNLLWKYDNDGRRAGVKWKECSDGKIQLIEHPLLSEQGQNYKNLYVGGIDSIDIGTTDSSNSGDNKKNSDFCVIIKKRILGLNDPGYICMYKDRPKDPREAYDTAAKILTYYNCQAVLESTRTAILIYFREKKFMHLLMKRPRSTLADVTKSNPNMYGTPTPVKVINHYRELIYDFCLDYSSTIGFVEQVEQLLQYSDEKKKDFDIVAAMGMAELGDEELSAKRPRAEEPKGTVFQDIGYFTDRNGYKQFGLIPRTEEEMYAATRSRTEDSWMDKELLSSNVYWTNGS